MSAFLVLSGIGPDRPGLVADVTAYLAARGGSVADSRMVILGAEFGMFILVSASEVDLGKVRADLAELGDKTGLSLLTRDTKDPAEHRRDAGLTCSIEAECLDHEGIVSSIAEALHRAGINVVSLETSAYPAPETGAPLFRFAAELDLPKSVTLKLLRALLDEVGRREGIDVTVHSVDS